MESLPSLALGPPLGFRSSSAPRATCDPSGVSSTFTDKGATFQDIPSFDYGALFPQHGMA
jgi:hypothetical protein